MKKVEFSECELKIIDAFNKSTNKKGDDWSSDLFTKLKKKIKDHYLYEQDYTCFFCQQRIKSKHNRGWDTEHIVSKASYPAFMFEPKNLCVTCIECNTEKSSKTTLIRPIKSRYYPSKSSSFTTIHPHYDRYEDHLKVIIAGEHYQYKTKKGRTTLLTYGLERFFEYVDRQKDTESSAEIKQLMQSAIHSNADYPEREIELFKALIEKHSEKIGDSAALHAIKSLRQPIKQKQ